jgi:NADH-quinone oxidoreductase subunit L
VTEWFSAQGVPLEFGYLLDGPNLVMGALVALISFLVHVYSLGYMAEDRERGRYFAFLSFFTWAMLSFVYAANLLQMFIFWELVGLASFLLIGFWYEKPSAAAAARKAFLMTRVGDIGFFIGMALLLRAAATLDLHTILHGPVLGTLAERDIEIIGVLLVLGVVGKSAQFPLHTWLPDAMEGPTPVSALLHSATMVAAGVYLFARFLPLFQASELVVNLVFVIASFTAFLAATVALVTRDLKRILAYSSISQLSFMLLGLAAGSLFAGLFHLVTHAFFKALLFLCAGSYIHALHTNDLVTIGRRGGRSMHWTTTGLVVGGAGLAGIPILAGFFSKEAILHAIGAANAPLVTALAYLAAFLTAYYTFRMVFLIVRPNPASGLPDEPVDPHAPPGHPHEPGWVMRAPIVVLTVLTIVGGFLGAAIHGLTSNVGPAHGTPSDHEFSLLPGIAGILPALAVAFAGVALAWMEFGRRGALQRGLAERHRGLARFFGNGWYVDHAYGLVFARLVAAISRVSAGVERRVLDASGDGVGRGTLWSGVGMTKLQGGRVQGYVALAVLVFTGCVVFVAGCGGGR